MAGQVHGRGFNQGLNHRPFDTNSGPSIARMLSGTAPGVLDPTQRGRLLRYPGSSLSFAHFHPLAASSRREDVDAGSVASFRAELNKAKRVVIEHLANGEAHWRFVPRAKWAPGVLDEGEWPRDVNVCGNIMRVTLDQWDIYKLDPKYTCSVPLDGIPSITVIPTEDMTNIQLEPHLQNTTSAPISFTSSGPAFASGSSSATAPMFNFSSINSNSNSNGSTSTPAASPSKPKRQMTPPLSGRRDENTEPKKRARTFAPEPTTKATTKSKFRAGFLIESDSEPEAPAGSKSKHRTGNGSGNGDKNGHRGRATGEVGSDSDSSASSNSSDNYSDGTSMDVDEPPQAFRTRPRHGSRARSKSTGLPRTNERRKKLEEERARRRELNRKKGRETEEAFRLFQETAGAPNGNGRENGHPNRFVPPIPRQHQHQHQHQPETPVHPGKRKAFVVEDPNSPVTSQQHHQQQQHQDPNLGNMHGHPQAGFFPNANAHGNGYPNGQYNFTANTKANIKINTDTNTKPHPHFAPESSPDRPAAPLPKRFRTTSPTAIRNIHASLAGQRAPRRTRINAERDARFTSARDKFNAAFRNEFMRPVSPMKAVEEHLNEEDEEEEEENGMDAMDEQAEEDEEEDVRVKLEEEEVEFPVFFESASASASTSTSQSQYQQPHSQPRPQPEPQSIDPVEAERLARIEESRRKMAELEKDKPLWQQAAARRAQTEELESRRQREERAAEEHAQRKARRDEKARLAREAEEQVERERAERYKAQRQQQKRMREAEEARQRAAREPWGSKRALEHYEELCPPFDVRRPSESDPLRFGEVPWPVLTHPALLRVEDVDWEAVEAFLARSRGHMRPQQFKAFVERAQRRFHPDRWRSRGLFRHVEDPGMADAMEVAVNSAAQAITALHGTLKTT